MDGGVRDLADPTLEQELTVVAALRHAGATAGPDPDERQRMRERVMAGFADTDFSDDTRSRVTLLTSDRTNRRSRRSAGAEARSRMVVAAAAALCLLMSLSGMSLLLSRDALPGDPLYGFKRSAESAELGLTFGQESRAFKHLEFATSRLNEIEVLAAEDVAGQAAAPQFVEALDDFDAAAVTGARMLTGMAVTGEAGVLDPLAVWTTDQRERLASVRPALPADAASRVTSTVDLLTQLEERVQALQDRTGCTAMTSGASDEFGPLPAEGACIPGPPSTAAPGSPPPGTPAAPGSPPPGTPAAPGAPPPAAPAPAAPNAPADPDPDQPRLSDVLSPPDRDDGGEQPAPEVEEPDRRVLPPLQPLLDPDREAAESEERPRLVPERSADVSYPGIR